MITRRTAVVIGAAGVLLGVAAIAGWFLLPRPAAPPMPTAVTTPALEVGGPFRLLAHDGRRVSDADFRGRYLLIFFGYTYCPDVCPTTLQRLVNVLDELGPAASAVTPLFITVDPARDTPEVLARYVAAFDPRIVGLTGTPEEIAAVAKAFRVYYARAGEDEDYLVDHSSLLYLMGPEGRFLAYFTHQTAPEAIAATIRERLAEAS